WRHPPGRNLGRRRHGRQGHRLQTRGEGEGRRNGRLQLDRVARQGEPRQGHGRDHGRPRDARHGAAVRRHQDDLRRFRSAIQNGRVKMAGRPIWYELMTPEPGAVAPFYRAVLGWEIPAEGHEMPNGSQYREIRRSHGGFAGGVLTLTPQMAGGGARPGWMTYFHVDDVDAAVAKATELGAAVHMPATTMDGVGRMAMIADPHGAALYL